MSPYKIFDHTADVGLLIQSPGFEDLLREGAAALYSVITDFNSLRKSLPDQRIDFDLCADTMEDLFLAWLREILFYFSAKKILFLNYQFDQVSEGRIKGSAEGILFNPVKHEQRCEVKAVTYHGFVLQPPKTSQDFWRAEVILDI